MFGHGRGERGVAHAFIGEDVFEDAMSARVSPERRTELLDGVVRGRDRLHGAIRRTIAA